MREDLIERLRSVKWEVTDEGDRMPDDPTQKCVFVDMRPDDFRALLAEAAELARRVDSAPVRNVVGQQWDDVFAREGNVVWCSDLHPGQRVRIVPEQGEGVE